MSWAACAMAHLADQMSAYTSNVQGWLDQAKRDLEDRHLSRRFFEVLGLGDDAPDILPMQHEVNDISRQMAALLLAIGTGTQFEWNEDRPMRADRTANGWLLYFASTLDDDPLERLNLGERLNLKMI